MNLSIIVAKSMNNVIGVDGVFLNFAGLYPLFLWLASYFLYAHFSFQAFSIFVFGGGSSEL